MFEGRPLAGVRITDKPKIHAGIIRAFERDMDYSHGPLAFYSGAYLKKRFGSGKCKAVGIKTNKIYIVILKAEIPKNMDIPARWHVYRWRPDWRDIDWLAKIITA